uniref:Uncharacterized protein n=1 Tax=Candidatus Nitrotoga fabula TaxID=2182327 RepID=A0A2X0RG64_9PROT|nr:protein of unknown function [Candidatus Nitrotoga fabula]
MELTIYYLNDLNVPACSIRIGIYPFLIRLIQKTLSIQDGQKYGSRIDLLTNLKLDQKTDILNDKNVLSTVSSK